MVGDAPVKVDVDVDDRRAAQFGRAHMACQRARRQYVFGAVMGEGHDHPIGADVPAGISDLEPGLAVGAVLLKAGRAGAVHAVRLRDVVVGFDGQDGLAQTNLHARLAQR